MVRIRGLEVVFQHLPETKVLLNKRLVGFLQLEIIFNVVVSLVDAAGDLGADIQKGSFVKFVEAKKKGQGDDLQHQEEEEVEMPSDEEKNVTHRCVVSVGSMLFAPGSFYRITNGYRS